MKELPTRKRNRLQGYDYSQNGAYFITICTKDRAEILGRIERTPVGANCVRPLFRPKLSEIGCIVENEISVISNTYFNIFVLHYVIMPNHIHMIIFNDGQDGRTVGANCIRPHPTVSRIIKQWKGAITKKIGYSVWQKSFHDHIIRNENDYKRIAEYIQNNPANWENDCFYGGK
ncbi:transposase [Stenoxybacter acetivorans]|uniref:transposase n=1 Tax=Stenoxybacter acetivorans TaxID=422441 RepID=UPI0005620F8C|nr:transposase [Stenoxybacter acetivorans]